MPVAVVMCAHGKAAAVTRGEKEKIEVRKKSVVGSFIFESWSC
jgi:hypothetical protein